jgi:hypothetical protein
MRMTESRLRRLIRSVIVEVNDEPLDNRGSGKKVRVQVGDKVRVLRVDQPYSGYRQDWGGCDGIVASVGGDFCSITDETMELSPLIDVPMNSRYIEIIEYANKIETI